MKILNTGSKIDFLLENPRVMVYYNLHKYTFSIKYKEKVVMHANYIKLSNVEFRVRQGGKERVRNEKVKNVHAFIIGIIEDFCEYPNKDLPNPKSEIVATYNPYENDSFIIKKTNEPIKSAKEVELFNLKNKIYIIKD